MNVSHVAPPFLARLHAALVPRFRLPACLAIAAGAAMLLLGGAARPLSAQTPPLPQNVMVRPGDTLSDIAVRFYGSPAAVARIAAANGIANPDHIVTGVTLRLPAADTAAATAGPIQAGVSAPTSARQVTVEAGDSLTTISQRIYGTPAYAAALAALNGITNPNLVVIGRKLTVPSAPPVVVAGASATAAGGGPLAGRRICLDPGHGGIEEPGAVFGFGDGRLLREADVTLDLARTLRAWLLADGASVTMTRNTDVYLGLDERAAICNAAGAEIAVSVHLNGGSSPSWNGALALFSKPVDRRLADRLAASLQQLGRNAPGLPFTAYGAQPFDGRVLLRTVMPAVIVEPVFLTNPGEARALLTPTAQGSSRRNQIVTETYRGIRSYFAQ